MPVSLAIESLVLQLLQIDKILRLRRNELTSSMLERSHQPTEV
jgi:hypothetical protein